MDFWQAISTCFRKYADFSGRAQRSEFWQWFLFCVLGILIALILDSAILGYSRPKLFFLIFFIVTLFPTVTAVARRLHDIDYSGWWQIVPLLIISLLVVGSINDMLIIIIIAGFALFASSCVLIGAYATEGTQGDNRFGPDPLAEEKADEEEPVRPILPR